MSDTKRVKEIDVLSLLKKVASRKKEMIIFVSVFFVIGVIVALEQQKRYTSYVVLAPEATSMGMSQNLSDIAGAIGMDIGGGKSSVDAIYPDIYPDVFASTDFVVKLFDIPVKVKGQKKTYYNHILQDTKIPFWDYPKLWLIKMFGKKDTIPSTNVVNPHCLTKIQSEVCEAIVGSIGCQINKGTNVITLSVTDTDARVAACMADSVKTRLQNYITLYRTKKARQDLAYSQQINAEAKAAYEKSRQKYASFADANSEVVLMSYQSKLEDLENDMQLKFNNYSQTAQQVLDKTAAVIGNKKGATANFKLSSPKYGSASGTITIKGNKFNARTPQAIVWYNGKTQWTYMKKTNEVNVSNPTQAKQMSMNPYTFIHIYKTGYKSSLKTVGSNYQVHLVANNQKRTVAEMYITINKNTHVPSQVKMRQGSTWSTINISGFKAKGVSNNSFVFNSKEFPGAEIIDLR